MATTNGFHATSNLDPASFPPEDIVSKDVCIIGGGGSGTYTAIRLRDHNKSVVVIEPKSRLGGHASTYKDPMTGSTLDIGVIVFGHLEEVKRFFARFDIPLKLVPTSLGPPDYVDFNTGKTVDFTPPDQKAVSAAFQRYAAQISKYPEVQSGFELTYPVPEDLLLPFGQFVQKHSIEALVSTIFAICQGYTSLLELSTLYVFKYFNADLLDTLSRGFLMTERHNVGELYEKAAVELGNDAWLDTSVIAMDRSLASGPVRILVKAPTGRKLILAKKVVSTVPHKLENLHGYDLSTDEKSLFGQFFHSAYYTGAICNTGLPMSAPIHAVGDGKPHGVPELPGIYALNPHSHSGLFQVYFGSPYEMSEEEVKAEIIAAVQRIQKARNISTANAPEFAAFENHTPFNMMVSNQAIRDGFYEKLCALQGQRHTFYNGASFHTQDSSVLWRFTEELLPRILAGI
ncbi:MAG: hypothetical protein MMC33_002506 [Icmadophila ericetorum]|nr:hypothetical protein [Icmadophila ericetorum]